MVPIFTWYLSGGSVTESIWAFSVGINPEGVEPPTAEWLRSKGVQYTGVD